MEEVVKNNVLDAIHYILKNQHQFLDEEKISKTDELIIPYIEENFEYSADEFRVKVYGAPVLSNDKRIFPIVVRYYAIMQDNLSLLEKLEENGYSFIGGNQHSIKLFALDKQLSSKFKEKEYIPYLKKHSVSLEHFYTTLRGLDHQERERVLKEFSEIVKSNPTVLSIGEDKNCSNFLSRRNIEFFGKEFLLSLDDRQRKLLNSFYFQINEDNASKIKELIMKYPDINMSMPLYKEVLDMFTIDELGTMSEKDKKLYSAALKGNVLLRMKEILSINPLFDCPKDFIRYEIFKELDNEKILELSYETMEEIANINYIELDNVYVIPVKKIYSVINKEKRKQLKDELIEKIDIFHRK